MPCVVPNVPQAVCPPAGERDHTRMCITPDHGHGAVRGEARQPRRVAQLARGGALRNHARTSGLSPEPASTISPLTSGLEALQKCPVLPTHFPEAPQ